MLPFRSFAPKNNDESVETKYNVQNAGIGCGLRKHYTQFYASPCIALICQANETCVHHVFSMILSTPSIGGRDTILCHLAHFQALSSSLPHIIHTLRARHDISSIAFWVQRDPSYRTPHVAQCMHVSEDASTKLREVLNPLRYVVKGNVDCGTVGSSRGRTRRAYHLQRGIEWRCVTPRD